MDVENNGQGAEIEREPAAIGAVDVEVSLPGGRPKKDSEKRLTGKQASFVTHYLGDARFNASLAAKMAGYRASSTHSFEEIGSQNLRKPAIRKAIDEHFRMSRMSADELLDELSKLARGDSKDKIRAIALLCQHHGILDGAGSQMDRTHNVVRVPPKVSKEEWSELLQLRIIYDDQGQEIGTRLPDEVLDAIAKVYDDKDGKLSNAVYNQRVADALRQTQKELNEKDELFTQVTKERNALYETKVNELCERHKDSPEVVQALRSTVKIVSFIFSAWSPLHVSTKGDLESFERHTGREQPEVEVIPPSKRLIPAPVERLMREVEDSEQPRQNHDQEAAAGRVVVEDERYTLTRFGMRVIESEEERSKRRQIMY